MRIVFWNIRAGGGVRVGRIASQIERWAPDAVALCEFRATPPSRELARDLAALGLPHQCTTAQAARPNANRLFLAARWPLTRIRLRTPCVDAVQLLLLASIEAPSPITLGVMHVPNRVTGRKDVFYAATLALLDCWRRGPAMLVGDTNSGRPGLDEETQVFGPREDAWLSGLERSGWFDAFRLRHRTARMYTWYSPNGRNGFRLDQAFVNDALRARLRDIRHHWGRRGGTGSRALSDHAAILVDLHPR
jgi:exodeoxyribonuclease III